MRNLYFYHELETMYEDMLNDCHEMVDICGMKYAPGRALKEIDPIAFRCGVSDWSSEDFEELSYSELTPAERDEYIASERTIMYVRKDENEEAA